VNALIVEDEEVVGRRLARLTRAILGPRLRSLAIAATVGEALERLHERALDLVFLDLDLNGDDGFRVLREAIAGAFQTIIVSAHAGQAIHAFEHGVTDFVVKPYGEERLRRALERVDQREPALRDQLRVLAVRRHGEIRLLAIDTLVRIAAADDYSELHCEDGATWLHDKTLAALEQLLPSRFERVHRSHIVDVRRIASWQVEEGSRYHLVLDRGDRVPASRTWIQEFRRRVDR
jgi:two-component system, LytTR family, response regulator LytT